MRGWIDRVWTGLVGVAFVVMVPIWLIEWCQDYGVLNVALVILCLFALGLIRGWPATD
jgi:hypothetical protein